MKQLTINRARVLGKDMNAKGIVILAFGDGGEFQAASYGRTKQDCGKLGKWLDGVYDAVSSGEIAPPFAGQQARVESHALRTMDALKRAQKAERERNEARRVLRMLVESDALAERRDEPAGAYMLDDAITEAKRILGEGGGR